CSVQWRPSIYPLPPVALHRFLSVWRTLPVNFYRVALLHLLSSHSVHFVFRSISNKLPAQLFHPSLICLLLFPLAALLHWLCSLSPTHQSSLHHHHVLLPFPESLQLRFRVHFPVG